MKSLGKKHAEAFCILSEKRTFASVNRGMDLDTQRYETKTDVPMDDDHPVDGVCSDDDATLTSLSGSSDTVRFAPSNNQRAIVSFESSDNWKVQIAYADGNACKWMSVSPMEGKKGKSSIS